MVQSFTEEFAVAWKDPADAQLSWTWDRMHFPRPNPALSAHVLEALEREIFGARTVFVNGYRYSYNSAPPPPTPEVIERGPFEVFAKDYAPRIEEACNRLRGGDYDSMSAAELADSIDSIVSTATDAFRYTMVVVFAFMVPTMELVEFCEQKLGKDGPQLLATLLQGTQNDTAAAGEGLADLAKTAAGLPEVKAAIANGRFADLEQVKGGAEFLEEVRKYLDEFGWRAESWGLPHVPTWAEDQHVPLMLIGRYLSDPASSPDAALRRSKQQHDEAMRELESRLSGEDLAEFKSKLAKCQGHVTISEDRARWQLTIIGSLRVPFLALGKKLVDAGALAEPNDVFFLDPEELRKAARSPSASLTETVAARKLDLERWERLEPPPFVGVPPDMSQMPPAFQTVLTKFFGLGVVPSTEKNVINGNAASRGSARGRARIIRDLSESDRLQQGEILVCPSTAPPWTPLFAIAAAIVTDTGGILSHSAICAREYGIPCVVGTQIGTQQIPDGAMITVDGAEGTVRIET
jgi:pyruvate,water dikinase